MILVPTGMDTNGQFRIAASNDIINGVPVIGGVPTLTMGSAAGTGASASIVGSNKSGKITMTTGVSLLSTGTVMTMTFANGFAYPNGCAIFFSSADVNFANVLTKIFATTTTTTASLTTSLSLSVGTTYVGYYRIEGW